MFPLFSNLCVCTQCFCIMIIICPSLFPHYTRIQAYDFYFLAKVLLFVCSFFCPCNESQLGPTLFGPHLSSKYECEPRKWWKWSILGGLSLSITSFFFFCLGCICMAVISHDVSQYRLFLSLDMCCRSVGHCCWAGFSSLRQSLTADI